MSKENDVGDVKDMEQLLSNLFNWDTIIDDIFRLPQSDKRRDEDEALEAYEEIINFASSSSIENASIEPLVLATQLLSRHFHKFPHVHSNVLQILHNLSMENSPLVLRLHSVRSLYYTMKPNNMKLIKITKDCISLLENAVKEIENIETNETVLHQITLILKAITEYNENEKRTEEKNKTESVHNKKIQNIDQKERIRDKDRDKDQNCPPSPYLFVGNLPRPITSTELAHFLSVVDKRITHHCVQIKITPKTTNLAYSFVSLPSAAVARKLMYFVRNTTYEGRPLVSNFARGPPVCGIRFCDREKVEKLDQMASSKAVDLDESDDAAEFNFEHPNTAGVWDEILEEMKTFGTFDVERTGLIRFHNVENAKSVMRTLIYHVKGFDLIAVYDFEEQMNTDSTRVELRKSKIERSKSPDRGNHGTTKRNSTQLHRNDIDGRNGRDKSIGYDEDKDQWRIRDERSSDRSSPLHKGDDNRGRRSGGDYRYNESDIPRKYAPSIDRGRSRSPGYNKHSRQYSKSPHQNQSPIYNERERHRSRSPRYSNRDARSDDREDRVGVRNNRYGDREVRSRGGEITQVDGKYNDGSRGRYASPTRRFDRDRNFSTRSSSSSRNTRQDSRHVHRDDPSLRGRGTSPSPSYNDRYDGSSRRNSSPSGGRRSFSPRKTPGQGGRQDQRPNNKETNKDRQSRNSQSNRDGLPRPFDDRPLAEIAREQKILKEERLRSARNGNNPRGRGQNRGNRTSTKRKRSPSPQSNQFDEKKTSSPQSAEHTPNKADNKSSKDIIQQMHGSGDESESARKLPRLAENIVETQDELMVDYDEDD